MISFASNGMTLRDYFAAKAMQAALEGGLEADAGQWDEICAARSYAIADAMLKERAK